MSQTGNVILLLSSAFRHRRSPSILGIRKHDAGQHAAYAGRVNRGESLLSGCYGSAASIRRDPLMQRFSAALPIEETSRQMTIAPRTADHGHGPIILFDAECVLCSANAQFVLKRDRAGYFRLASMQGAIGADIYRAHGMDPKNPSSILIVDGDRVRQDSDAVLSIYEALGFPWRFLTIFRLIPAFLRDPVYRWVARNRYSLFGKRTQCWVAPPAYRDRIL